MSDTPQSDPNSSSKTTAPGAADIASQGGPSWLLAPGELPAGVQFALTAVVEAAELRPGMIEALTRVAQEIQHSPGAALPQARCGPLTSCDNMTGDCGRLRHCGTYRVGPSPL